MKITRNTVLFLFVTYPFGILLGVGFWLFRALGIVKVVGWRNSLRIGGRVLVVSNHPSLLEPITLIGMFFHRYVFRPFRFGPWNLSDRRNYYDNPLFFCMRSRLIPIERGSPKEELKGLTRAEEILRESGIVIIFPEGGRTFKGRVFLESASGKKMRPFKRGFARLASRTGATVLPVWVEGTDRVLENADAATYSFPKFWRTVTVCVGEPRTFTGMDEEVIARHVERTILDLADQEVSGRPKAN